MEIIKGMIVLTKFGDAHEVLKANTVINLCTVKSIRTGFTFDTNKKFLRPYFIQLSDKLTTVRGNSYFVCQLSYEAKKVILHLQSNDGDRNKWYADDIEERIIKFE